MLINSQLVKDHFGQFYKIQTSKDKTVSTALQAELFRSNAQAKTFINNLTAPVSFWSKIYHSESLFVEAILNDNHLKSEIAELLHKGRVKAYKIDIPTPSNHPPEKRTVQDSSKNNHTFTPASTLLISSPKEVKSFANKADAEKYLSEISADDKQLKTIASELNLPADDLGAGNISDVISTALASGELVVVVDRYSAPPKAEETAQDSANNSVGNRKVELSSGAGVAAASTQAVANDDKPDCIYKKFTLTCRHGRSVTLDPAKPLDDGQVTRLQIVSSRNEDLKDNGQPVFDILTVNAEIDDVCPGHQTNFISNGDSEAKLIGMQSNGELAKFKSPSKELLVGNGGSVLKYLWLPNVEADGTKHYKISANQSCDFSHFSGKDRWMFILILSGT